MYHIKSHAYLFSVNAGIEEQVRNIQAKKQALKENISDEPEKQRVGLGAGGHFDTDIYGSTRSKFEGYHTYIAPNEDAEVSWDVKFICYMMSLLFSG